MLVILLTCEYYCPVTHNWEDSMADTDDTAPVIPIVIEDGVSVTKRKRGRPPKPFAMPGQFRNAQYRKRLAERTQEVHAGFGLLLGACLKAGAQVPPVVLNVACDPVTRHETIKSVREVIRKGHDFEGEGAHAIKWLEEYYRPETYKAPRPVLAITQASDTAR